MRLHVLPAPLVFAFLLICGGQAAVAAQAEPPSRPSSQVTVSQAHASVTDDSARAPSAHGALAVGDLVFIRVSARPFLEVAEATGGWTNHVGVVVDAGDGQTAGGSGAGSRGRTEPLIAESTFPLSRITPWTRFVARSEGGRVEVHRLAVPLTPEQARRVRAAADSRLGIIYDTGFDLHSRRQFCSRFVREVLAEATGIQLGEVESFAHLLARRPDTRLGFWRIWYLGAIPWQRKTVTPASIQASPELRKVEIS